jgi:thymidylate synthase (FAD)
MRTDPSAEEEMRLVFDQIARICASETPALFQDFTRSDDGTWVPRYRKV